MENQNPDLLQAAAKIARALGGDHLVIVGGLAGFLHGVDRYTTDVDLATDLTSEEVAGRLAEIGLATTVHAGAADDPLPWVAEAEIDGVPVQILPIGAIGADVGAHPLLEEYGLRLVSAQGFIRSKCYAGGHQDMLDVAVLVLKNPPLAEYARDEARRHGGLDLLNRWLSDRRILAKYAPPPLD